MEQNSSNTYKIEEGSWSLQITHIVLFFTQRKKKKLRKWKASSQWCSRAWRRAKLAASTVLFQLLQHKATIYQIFIRMVTTFSMWHRRNRIKRLMKVSLAIDDTSLLTMLIMLVADIRLRILSSHPNSLFDLGVIGDCSHVLLVHKTLLFLRFYVLMPSIFVQLVMWLKRCLLEKVIFWICYELYTRILRSFCSESSDW